MNQPRNIGASIRQRLKNLAARRGEDFQLVLTRYANDRFLYRLSQSPYRDRFILKGALLFNIWSSTPHRITRDVDLLGRGDNTLSHLEFVFRSICQIPFASDGLDFNSDTIRSQRLKKDQEYEGARITFRAYLALSRTRVDLQFDIGFGDAVTPEPALVELPAILDLEPPRLWIYPRYTVVAEKFQAMVMLGMSNTRIKDFYDLWFLALNFEFEGEILVRAMRATFERRKTALPKDTPLALTSEFSTDLDKSRQWVAFTNKSRLISSANNFTEVIVAVGSFLMPPCVAAAKNESFSKVWLPGGSWN